MRHFTLRDLLFFVAGLGLAFGGGRLAFDHGYTVGREASVHEKVQLMRKDYDSIFMQMLESDMQKNREIQRMQAELLEHTTEERTSLPEVKSEVSGTERKVELFEEPLSTQRRRPL